MDPFSQVYADALEQVAHTEALLQQYDSTGSSDVLADVTNATQELVETIHDLSQSVGVVQSKPSQFGLSEYEIDQRIDKVGSLNTKLAAIQDKVTQVKRHHAKPDVDKISGALDSADGEGQVSSLMYAEAIQEQDAILDSVYTSVNTLRQQANVMSRELEDQSQLMEQFDRDMDATDSRLQGGLKRIQHVLRNSEDTLSGCCVWLLIIVLIVLLVLVIVL